MVILNVLAATLTPILMKMHFEKKELDANNKNITHNNPVDSVEIINKIDKSIPDNFVDFDYFWGLFDFDHASTNNA